MLPNRLSSRISPADALRHSTKTLRPRLSRNFSQLSSQSRNAPIIRGTARPSVSRLEPTASPRPLPSIHSSGVGALGASTVFATRSGASRNLSLWPFGSKKSSPLPSETTTSDTLQTSTSDAESSAAGTTPVSPDDASSASPASPASPGSLDDPASLNASSSLDAPAPDLSSDPASLNSTLDGLDFTSILDIPVQIGYLKSLGLEFGPGPTSSCAWLLEHIHVYSGLPWWGSLLAVATLWRAVIFIPTLYSTKSSALLQEAQKNPEYQAAFEAFKVAAYRTKDQMAMMDARRKMRAVTGKSGYKIWLMGVPFLTVPFSFGMFRLMRGMAAIPVPSFEHGGLAWFADLTVHDPFYILPIANVALGLLMLRQNQAASMNRQQQFITKGMMYIFPPLVFFTTAWLPAGLQWFFLCLTGTTIIQTTATLNPAIRNWVGLPPLPSKVPNPAAAAATAASGAVWQAPTKRPVPEPDIGIAQGIKKQVKDALGQDDRKREWEEAQRYEERRAAEEKEKLARRLEESRRRRR